MVTILLSFKTLSVEWRTELIARGLEGGRGLLVNERVQTVGGYSAKIVRVYDDKTFLALLE